jgi:Ca-activated chloride channel homolog
MQWAHYFTNTEWVFAGIFLLAYLLLAIRTLRIGRKLGFAMQQLIPKFIIRSAAFALLIIALLGPSFGETTREIKAVGKDIYFCVDLSQSMDAFDIQPTRLEKVKFELKNIVSAFSSDRIGLIMFSNEAFLQCPLTYDNNAINLFIQTLHTGLVPNTGTDFGPPLRMALQKLAQEEKGSGRQKSSIIVLVSDGEDFGEETEIILKEISSKSVRLFTLGVGTEAGGKIMTSRGFKKDREGKEVVTRLNPEALKKMADKTNGKYFEINDRRNDVERLINAINAIEGELKDIRKMDVGANKYMYFLMGALMLLLIDVLFQVKVFRI